MPVARCNRRGFFRRKSESTFLLDFAESAETRFDPHRDPHAEMSKERRRGCLSYPLRRSFCFYMTCAMKLPIFSAALSCISHKLNEVKEICDRITVLRRGRVIDSANIEDVSEQDISRMMVGRDVMLDIQKDAAQPKQTVLSVRNLHHKNRFGVEVLKGVSFDLRRGEILGVAGVEGNGQSELGELLTGLIPISEGDVQINGCSIRGKTIRQIREMQASLIHEDRMIYGVSSTQSIRENLISDSYYKPRFQKHGFLKKTEIQKTADELVESFRIKCDSAEAAVRTLSGGNVQKVVAAREFSSKPKLLVVSQPTRGIDVGAAELIRRKIIALRDDHDAGVLMFSADLTEILTVSDSIIVLCGGQIAAYFPDARAVNQLCF